MQLNYAKHPGLLMCMIFLGSFAFNVHLIQKAVAQDESESDEDKEPIYWLRDFSVPIAVAIIGAVAASWNFIQAKWNGHYFQNLILRELAELEPDEIEPEDGLLKSHMKDEFMHREILYNPTENKEFIFTVNNQLIYLTRQVWSAFDNNDVVHFLLYLHYLTTYKRHILHIIPVHYSRREDITKAMNKWINTLKKPEVQNNNDVFKLDKEGNVIDVCKDKIKPIFLVSRTEKIYCRYCGKQRETSQEFCSMCGRSSHSSSTAVKKCTSCKTTMSEDSEFCANCGQKFEEKATVTKGTKRVIYTSDGKMKER